MATVEKRIIITELDSAQALAQYGADHIAGFYTFILAVKCAGNLQAAIALMQLERAIVDPDDAQHPLNIPEAVAGMDAAREALERIGRSETDVKLERWQVEAMERVGIARRAPDGALH